MNSGPDSSTWTPNSDNVKALLDIAQLVGGLALKLHKGQPIDEGLPKLRCMLRWLDGPIVITPRMHEYTRVGGALKALFEHKDPAVRFPADIAAGAKALYYQFSATGWGNPAAGRTGEVDGPYNTLATITIYQPAQGAELPPAAHDIYGDLGIMYGTMAVKEGPSIKLVQRPDRQTKDYHVHGHNNLLVGAWFPNRLLARIHGAHGAPQAGISGTTGNGAYSIVLSADYADLDLDQGNIIFYSGPNSHSNTNPDAIAADTQGAACLHTSIRTRKPVRVLRSSKAASVARPSCGIRYDGLYLVTGVEPTLNPSGGQYERFRLERQGNQLALEDITTPTSRQVADYNRIKRYYGSLRC